MSMPLVDVCLFFTSSPHHKNCIQKFLICMSHAQIAVLHPVRVPGAPGLDVRDDPDQFVRKTALSGLQGQVAKY